MAEICLRQVPGLQAASENLCPYAKFTGYDENCGYAEYAMGKGGFCVWIPPGLETNTATPLLCAGIIGFRAMKRAAVKPGCRLGLFGFGSSADIAIQVVRLEMQCVCHDAG